MEGKLKFKLCSNKISTALEITQLTYIIWLIRILVVEDGMQEGIQRRGWRWSYTQSGQSVLFNILQKILSLDTCFYPSKCRCLVLPCSIHCLHSWESHFSKIKTWLCHFVCKQDLTAFRINFSVATYEPSWSAPVYPTSCISHHFLS